MLSCVFMHPIAMNNAQDISYSVSVGTTKKTISEGSGIDSQGSWICIWNSTRHPVTGFRVRVPRGAAVRQGTGRRNWYSRPYSVFGCSSWWYEVLHRSPCAVSDSLWISSDSPLLVSPMIVLITFVIMIVCASLLTIINIPLYQWF